MRCNLIGLCGFALSLSSAVLFIDMMWLESLGMSSADSQLHRDMSALQFNLGLLYFMGIGISAFSSLGSLVQLPSLGVLLPLTWYLDYADSVAGYGVFALAFLANFILVLSMFVGVECPGGHLSIPPKSRMRWWGVHGRHPTSKPLSESAKFAVVSFVVASAVILASFTYYVRADDVSRLTVVVMINGASYGSVNFVVYLDGENAYSGAMVHDGGQYVMDEWLYLELSSGSHTLELDAWNDWLVLPLSAGVVDSVAHVRTLPFTEEMTFLTLGVDLI